MRIFFIIPIMLTIAFSSCDDGELLLPEQDYSALGGTLTQEEERAILTDAYSSIYDFAISEKCRNDNDWTYTPIGSKACGGPQGHIPYSNNIDVTSFLNDVQEYTDAEEAYNIRWSVISDCSLVSPPSSVQCVNGVAELVY